MTYGLVLFSCGLPKMSSQSSISPEQVAHIVPQTAVVDQLGNLYFANVNNEIYKQDPTGKQVGYYSNNQLGNVGRIDATSPLKVLVFYPAFNTGVVLDRRLLETSRFNLIEMGFGEIELVAFSRDGTIWIFDDHEQRIYKVDQKGNILLKGGDLRLVFDERLQPIQMTEAGEYLYLAVPGRGLLIFDLFGQYKSQILRPEIGEFQVIEHESVVLIEKDDLGIIELQTLEERHYQLPEKLRTAKLILTKHEIIAVSNQEVRRFELSAIFK
jgi:hypothetical protein